MKINEVHDIHESFNRLNDVFFKYVFASPERRHLTIAFLNAVLNYIHIGGDVPVVVEDIVFIDRETTANWRGEKVPRFDIFVKAVDGRIFHIEIQDARDIYFWSRCFYYFCHDFNIQLKSGDSYKDLRPVVFVGLANFSLTDEPHEWYTLHRVEDAVTHELSTDLMTLHMIDLPELRHEWRAKKRRPSGELEEILFFFANKGGKHMTELQEIASRNSIVAELLELERKFLRDPILVRKYELDERAHLDYLANLEYERNEGLAQGRSEGFAEGCTEERNAAARSLRSQGILTDEQIAEALNMPIEAVGAL